ncbi:hydroxymethylbilane synthase [Candidatus Saganbacteria bacterium]|nr:hydroxymethylbilane synthase [Candidatus Saganbacteria bacterium]
MAKKISIGTRGSRLAIAQSSIVADELSKKFKYIKFELKIIKTKGDMILNVPLSKIGGKGLFVKEIEQALLKHKIDLAVHSLKDLPTDTPKKLMIAAVTKREDPRDVIISRGTGQGARIKKIGTSSLRRKAQLLAKWPDLDVVDIRGNLDTRIRKMDELGLDAIVVAYAGIKRLKLEVGSWKFRIAKIPFSWMLPASGQGAVAIECRSDDEETIGLLKKLNHPLTEITTRAERALLFALGGGCQVPIGAFAVVRGNKIILDGVVAKTDGKKVIRAKLSGPKNDPEKIGTRLAAKLIKMGANKILGTCE